MMRSLRSLVGSAPAAVGVADGRAGEVEEEGENASSWRKEGSTESARWHELATTAAARACSKKARGRGEEHGGSDTLLRDLQTLRELLVDGASASRAAHTQATQPHSRAPRTSRTSRASRAAA